MLKGISWELIKGEMINVIHRHSLHLRRRFLDKGRHHVWYWNGFVAFHLLGLVLFQVIDLLEYSFDHRVILYYRVLYFCFLEDIGGGVKEGLKGTKRR